MKPTTGFFIVLTNSQACSSSEPPISPIMTTASVASSASNIRITSMKRRPGSGSPPIPTQVVWPMSARVISHTIS